MIDMEKSVEEVRAENRKEREEADGVKLVGLDVPLGDLMWLLVKLAIAAVPAGLIVALFYWAFASFFHAMLRAY